MPTWLIHTLIFLTGIMFVLATVFVIAVVYAIKDTIRQRRSGSSKN